MPHRLKMDPIPRNHPKNVRPKNPKLQMTDPANRYAEGETKPPLWNTTVVFYDGQRFDGEVAYFSASSHFGDLVFGLGNDDRLGWAWSETGGGGPN